MVATKFIVSCCCNYNKISRKSETLVHYADDKTLTDVRFSDCSHDPFVLYTLYTGDITHFLATVAGNIRNIPQSLGTTVNLNIPIVYILIIVKNGAVRSSTSC
ncbi:hypothetical protein RIR_jg37440.t1 [Rhizophagus irregularis DAOM 181602=DAOM 197198]|nr:hypothetical protein RIR_jg37440.t1 [Rhizophagus irregularis DAOM 181602=DAOM 197198]